MEDQLEIVHVNGVKGYTTYGVTLRMDNISRQAVNDYAITHEWRRLGRIGRVVIWNAHDVDKSLQTRQSRQPRVESGVMPVAFAVPA